MDIEEVDGDQTLANPSKTGNMAMGGHNIGRVSKNLDIQRTETGFKRITSTNFISNPGFGSGTYSKSNLRPLL